MFGFCSETHHSKTGIVPFFFLMQPPLFPFSSIVRRVSSVLVVSSPLPVLTNLITIVLLQLILSEHSPLMIGITAGTST